MMHFLVINCGTASVKITLFDIDEESPKRVVDGHLNNLFSPHPILEIGEKSISLTPISSYREAIKMIISNFEKEGFSFSSLQAVGHRIVHGGEKYIQTTLITPAVVEELEELSQLAPLHNPPALEGIKCSQQLFPHTPQIAVFDTAFHATLPPKAAFYPIPWDLSQKYRIKRYGFHGIAHAFSWDRYINTFGKEKEHPKVITVHLGGGCSLAAIDDGTSIDTSMGFTPLDGVMMATRCGELDPSIVAFLCKKEEKNPEEMITILNQKSGLLGISGKTGNINEILKNSSSDSQAQLALEIFTYSILKKIGSYLTVLGGIDALIFSGGVGEHVSEIRSRLVRSLSWFPILIDEKKNEACTHLKFGEIECIHQPSSKAALCVVGTDENLFIAKEMMQSRSAKN